MSLVTLQPGWHYPDLNTLVSTSSAIVLDAAAEEAAFIGRLYIDGAPAGAKTLSTGTIQFRLGTVTFANAGTTLDVGIQDLATGVGPPAQPDGTFDVLTTLTGGGGGLSANAWNTVTMSSGSKNMTHGDLIAVVFDMTARAGADTITIQTHNQQIPSSSGSNGGLPVTNVFLGGAWGGTGSNRTGSVIIVFDDGTLGWLDLSIPVNTVSSEAFQDSTNPDGRGMIFQVPFDCEVDQLWAWMTLSSASATLTLNLYSDPTGTPALLASGTYSAEQNGAALGVISVPISATALSKNTDYLVEVRATGAANVSLSLQTFGNTAHRAAVNNGLTFKKATRNNGSGAFTEESPAITKYSMGVRIIGFHDGAGGGGGIKLAGRGGLAG